MTIQVRNSVRDLTGTRKRQENAIYVRVILSDGIEHSANSQSLKNRSVIPVLRQKFMCSVYL